MFPVKSFGFLLESRKESILEYNELMVFVHFQDVYGPIPRELGKPVQGSTVSQQLYWKTEGFTKWKKKAVENRYSTDISVKPFAFHHEVYKSLFVLGWMQYRCVVKHK